ncbi:4'-phosphopantetheinyl transferase superfamily protein [Dyella sp. LX-66]|uniref:4'-phosphopantetheinyl transferase family protein n=1 Tax=unclassified Dyella TaxID=2634549 RepID=UPI001BDFB811|nr:MULTISPECIES: 4'-phosphopantetheinyl transferase superfamily protein [unclassified Dyella]MBT2118876.1 4'-phosphopantetheinyl transferase superfamily protein [Dyella sp. LX-1]MBT2140131.1 4'-phosphopantetheinyl transferase superfamily protein [Dyella sp. LX-66]
MSAAADERAVAALFAAPVAACIADPDMFAAPLFAEEEAYISKAIPARRREYSAGRAAARKALARAGGAPEAIVADADRSPRWPASFCGSITHCEGFCSAVVARSDHASGLGFDAESAKPLGGELHYLVCRPNELEHFQALPPVDGVDWPKLAFSAKESFYKCYYPGTRSFLEFRDVSVVFSVEPGAAGKGGFAIVVENKAKPMPRPGAEFIGRWMADGRRVYTGVTLPRS